MNGFNIVNNNIDQNNLDSVPKKNALAYISPSGKSVRDNNLKVKKRI